MALKRKEVHLSEEMITKLQAKADAKDSSLKAYMEWILTETCDTTLPPTIIAHLDELAPLVAEQMHKMGYTLKKQSK